MGWFFKNFISTANSYEKNVGAWKRNKLYVLLKSVCCRCATLLDLAQHTALVIFPSSCFSFGLKVVHLYIVYVHTDKKLCVCRCSFYIICHLWLPPTNHKNDLLYEKESESSHYLAIWKKGSMGCLTIPERLKRAGGKSRNNVKLVFYACVYGYVQCLFVHLFIYTFQFFFVYRDQLKCRLPVWKIITKNDL